VKRGAAEEAERLTRANLERTAAMLMSSWERGQIPYWSPSPVVETAEGGDKSGDYS
jgi:hypothetical protein